MPAYTPDRLRRVKLSPWLDQTRAFILTTFDTHETDHLGKSILSYTFETLRGEIIFQGSDFACSPMHGIDSDECLRSLLGFLTLRPGDTDAEYFENYTERQRRFCDEDAETLAMYADEDSTDQLIDLLERYRMTYQTVTPESAEDGDFEDTGYELERCTLKDALAYGSFNQDSGSWFDTTTPEHDRAYFERGEEKTYSLHPSRDITPASYARLKRILTAR